MDESRNIEWVPFYALDPTGDILSEDGLSENGLSEDGLSEDDLAAFEQELAQSPTLQAELAAFQATVAALAYAAPPEPIAPALKDRLFNSLGLTSSPLLALLSQSLEELRQVATDLSNWQSMQGSEQAELAIWRIDKKHKQVAFFVRSPGPGPFPAHWHAEGEEVLVLAGDFCVDEVVCHPGDRIFSPANTAHQPHTQTGCLVFCVSSVEDKILT